MFRATMCSSSGENTVLMLHLVFVTVYIKLCTKLFLFKSGLNSEVTITGLSSVQSWCNACHLWL